MKKALLGLVSLALLAAVGIRVELVAQAVEPGERLALAPSDSPERTVDPRGEAVHRGLEWLAAHVEEDGGWSLRHGLAPRHEGPVRDEPQLEMRTAASGLALLSFLSAGHTHQQGSYQSLVAGGLKFLQQQAQVSPSGASLIRGEGGSMYCHAIATLAVCEACRRTKDPQLAKFAQQAIDFTVSAQDAQGGGWRYSPNQAGDTSSTCWQVRSLASAHSAGLKVPKKTFAGAMRYLDSVAANKGGSYGYTTPGDRPCTNAVGLVARMQLGWQQDRAGMARGLKSLIEDSAEVADVYLQFHISTLVREQTGQEAARWLDQVRQGLIKQQITDGKPEGERGSWSPGAEGYGKSGGRLLATALAVQILAEQPRGYWKVQQE